MSESAKNGSSDSGSAAAPGYTEEALAAEDDGVSAEEAAAAAAEREEAAEEISIYDADLEDAVAEAAARSLLESATTNTTGDPSDKDDSLIPAEEMLAPSGVRSLAELVGIVEALIFVSEEPLSAKILADVLKEDRGWVESALHELTKEFNERPTSGLMLREVAGGWQFATRPEHHEHVRAFLKSRPSAKLSLAALETLAVIAYKQPITVPEILEIRGVQSSSAIKTLLDKRLIISKGRKETVGRPMMYGTSKEFLMQFGMRDLSELPSIEDFEDLTGSGA